MYMGLLTYSIVSVALLPFGSQGKREVAIRPASAESLNHTSNSSQKSYTGAVTDRDLYPCAIAADLVTYHRLRHEPIPRFEEDMVQMAYSLHKYAIVKTPDGGWLLQPGAWNDHNDFAYSNSENTDIKSPKALPSQATLDASHFTRWPLWFTSWAESCLPGSAERKQFDEWRNGLNTQFFHHVVTPPDDSFRLPRLKNFMDGSNGVYRRFYHGSTDKGYGPYELSGTMFYGWWVFLYTPEAKHLYREIESLLPVTKTEEETYTRMGADDLQVRLAAKLNLARQVIPPQDEATEDEKAKWEHGDGKRLQDEIWTGSNAQMVQYRLMVPLHFAFWNKEEQWQKEFADHFQRFAAVGPHDEKANTFDRFHYWYFATRFICLAESTGHSSLIPAGLPTAIEAELKQIWNGENPTVSETGWKEPAFSNFETYLKWKVDLAHQRHGG